MRTPSPKEIRNARTERGGWTKAQLEIWGVEWPPPKGWRKTLERRWIKEQTNDASGAEAVEGEHQARL